jgi:uncharacterized protein YjbI with pentapeptide repeats
MRAETTVRVGAFSPGVRAWRRLCVAPLVLAAVVMTGGWFAAERRPAAAPVTSGVAATARPVALGVPSPLSVQAQSVISSTVGAGDARFSPRRRPRGFQLVGGGVTAALGRAGATIGGRGGRLSVGLTAVGRAGHWRQLAAVAPRTHSHRVVYVRGGGVLEWYAAGPLGVEQGFTLARRPAGRSGAVTLAMGLGGLRARLRGSGVDFLARSGRVAFRYGGLVARDARGRRLPARLSLLGSRLLLRVKDRGARYPLRIDPFIQQGPKLTASDESGPGSFGSGVALSADGNTALIGGPDDDNDKGAAWVFTRSGDTWTQQGPKLTASDESGPGWFGSSVALSADGNTALIGGPADGGSTGVDGDGAAWVFTRTGSTWTQQGAKLPAPDQSAFGSSVALSADGNTALIGGPNDNNGQGTTWVFTRSGSQWTQQGPGLTADDETGESNFGGSVALSADGNTALIGGLDDNNFVGAAWGFTRSGSTWTQEGPKLTARDESGEGGFGGSVALSADGRTALIGGSNDGTAGAAWVFKSSFNGSGLSWTQQGAKLTATDADSQASFGTSVALSADGNTALIGGVGDNGAVGAAWMFAVATWTQQGPKLTPSDASGEANFGDSVALSADGTTQLIGGLGDNKSVGAAWAFVAKNQAVYWDNPQAGTIGRDDGPPSQINQDFITGAQPPTRRLALAADSEHLYWAAGAFIARANLDGSDVEDHFIDTGASVNSVAVDGQYVYWTTGASIGRADLNGSSVEPQFITVPGAFLSGLAVDSGHLYWKDERQRSIGSANLDGSGIDDSFVSGAGGSPGAVAVDAQHIYWTNVTGASAPFLGAIGRANIDGSSATPNFITGVDDPSGLAVDDNFIYWASDFSCNFQNDPPTSCGGGTIGRANLDGSGVNPSFTTADGLAGPGCGNDPETRCGPTSVAVATLPDGSSALYWDNPQVGAIGRETIDGNPGNVNQGLVTGITQLFHEGVAVDPQHLFWTDGASIGESNLDGTGANQQFIGVGQGAADYLAVDDRYLYWSNGAEIGRANLDGSDVIPGFINLRGDDVGGLAVDSSHIYWADRTHGTIGRANLDGSGVNSSFITGATNATDVAVDGQYVYWTQIATSGLPPAGSIGRANLDGSGANSSFITGAAEPFGITVDYDHIYWTNYYNCDNQTQPPSGCAGGTIGRANLDGSAVNQAYITAAEDTGPGCNTDPQTRCGPSTVAVSAPTQPHCMRTSITPAPPPGGAVFAQPLDPNSSDANVVVIPAAASWTGPSSCSGIAQGSDAVMTHPTSISVAPDAAVLLRDQPAGLFSAWGAQDVGPGDPAPVLFPGRSDWQTTEVDMIAPQQLLDTYNGCPLCVLPDNIQFTPGQPSPDVAYQGNVSGAVLNGASLTGNFDGWNFTGAQLPGASLNKTDVSGADFTGADLRGAQLTSLQESSPPTLANVRVGQFNGSCTVFGDVDLMNTSFIPVKADLLVPGCESTPLFPGSTAPLGVIKLMAVTDGATVDFADGQFVATAADSSSLAGANLQGIDLAGASFLGFPADLESTNFDGATLDGASFELADLTKGQFAGVHAVKASFEDATLTGASFAGTKTDLEGADFAQADVSGASFQDADITGATFDGVLGVGTSFTSVIGTKASFNGAHIYGDGNAFDQARQLGGADFVGAVLGGSEDGSGGFDLTDANLTGAKFDGAQCISCNLTGATLVGASFVGAYLPGAQLSGAQLNGAEFDRAWLFCGTLSDGLCQTNNGLQWDVALGSQETYGPVPFTTTSLNEGDWAGVSTCPDGSVASPSSGCAGHLLPTGTFVRPACSAATLDACQTPTSTLFDATSLLAGTPISVTAATPPTWASDVTTDGDYVGLTDGTVRLVTPNGETQVIAGQHNSPCSGATNACGDGGPAVQSRLGRPAGLAVGLDGSLYIADPVLHRVRRIDPGGTITTVAGDGQTCSSPAASCGDGGPATAAALADPTGVWSSPAGDLFIADGQRGIREVHPDGTISTVSTGAPGTYDIVSVVGDASGNLWAAADNPDYLLQITPGGQTSVAVGTGTSGYNGDEQDGLLTPGNEVQVDHPQSLSVALNGDIVFADTGNNLIRAYNPSTGFMTADPVGLVDANGNPEGGFNGDGLPGNQTELDNPAAVTVTRGAILVIADTGNQRVRAVGPNPPPAQLTSPGSLPPAAKPPVSQPRPTKTPARRRLPNNHAHINRIHTTPDGTITFTVRVPGPGRIDVLATAWNNNLARAAVLLHPAPHRFTYARSHTTARRATTLHLRVTPNARGKRLLHHHTYPIVLRLWVTFTPTRGHPHSIGFYGLHLPRPRTP